jgi:hypothetical protein
MCFINKTQPQVTVGIALPEDGELRVVWPLEDALLAALSNLFIKKGRDIFT